MIASEVHALVLGFEEAFVVRHLKEEILDVEVEIHSFVDSKNVFDRIGRDEQTNERRLQIDISVLKESYAVRKGSTR